MEMMSCDQKSGAGQLSVVLGDRMGESGISFKPEIPDGDVLCGMKFSLTQESCGGWWMSFEVKNSDEGRAGLSLFVDGFYWMPDADSESSLTGSIVPAVRRVEEVAAVFGLTELVVPGGIVGICGMSGFPDLLGCQRVIKGNSNLDDTVFFQICKYVKQLDGSVQ